MYSILVTIIAIVCFALTTFFLSFEEDSPTSTHTKTTTSTHYRFVLTLTIFNGLAICFDLIVASFFVEAGTPEDISWRQRAACFWIPYLIIFAVSTSQRDKTSIFIVPATFQLFGVFHLFAGEPNVLSALFSIFHIIVWVLFLSQTFST